MVDRKMIIDTALDVLLFMILPFCLGGLIVHWFV